MDSGNGHSRLQMYLMPMKYIPKNPEILCQIYFTPPSSTHIYTLQDVIKAFNDTVLNFYFKKEPKFNELIIQPKKENKITNKNSKRNPKQEENNN